METSPVDDGRSEPAESEPSADTIALSRITVADAGEVLTIQRAAFVSEALIYGDVRMPPLMQTLEELEAELEDADGWVARSGDRLVGAIRTRESDGMLLIGRIAIAPDMQGEGIGRLLLEAAEQHSAAASAELFKCPARVTRFTTRRSWVAVTAVASSAGAMRATSSNAVHDDAPGSSAATKEYAQPGIICACPRPRA